MSCPIVGRANSCGALEWDEFWTLFQITDELLLMPIVADIMDAVKVAHNIQGAY